MQRKEVKPCLPNTGCYQKLLIVKMAAVFCPGYDVKLPPNYPEG